MLESWHGPGHALLFILFYGVPLLLPYILSVVVAVACLRFFIKRRKQNATGKRLEKLLKRKNSIS